MPWLQELGKVIHDYKQLTMEFLWKGVRVTLQGVDGLEPRKVSYNQLYALMDSDAIQEMYEVKQMTEVDDTNLEKMEWPIDISQQCRQLLVEFSAVFMEPNRLPPRRVFNHRIHLQPGSQPVNV